MPAFGTLYGNSSFCKTTRVLAAAAYNGLEINMVQAREAFGAPLKPEVVQASSYAKVPVFVGADGFTLIESRAIARYVAGHSSNANLLGSDEKSAALVEQWISFADDEVFKPLLQLLYLFRNLQPYNKNLEEKTWESFNRALTYLESYLKKQTFVVGHRVTLADLTLAANLHSGFTTLVGEEVRSKYPNVIRYTETVTHQAQVLKVFTGEYVAENGKFVPPKKEEKPKAAAAPAAAKKEEKPKASKKKDDDDDDDDTPPAPKQAPHPCASLPPSPFNLEEAKRQYSNLDTPDFLKWFYENFDKAGFSIWKFDFKYNNELTQIFMSANQIGGYFSRLEGSRKYVLGSGAVYGTANDSIIAGVIITRGKEWEPCLNVAPDTDSYEISALDVFGSEGDKKFFEENLKWEGEYKGKAFADGKTLK